MSVALCAFLACWLAAMPAAAAPSGGFTGIWTFAPTSADAARSVSARAGWARVQVVWATVQPTSAATFDWSGFDQAVVNASGGGARRVLLMVRDNPQWAATLRCRVGTPDERQRLATFASALVNRYKQAIPDGPFANQVTNVKYWQFYNEPDNTSVALDTTYGSGGCFATTSGGAPTAQGRDDYALMLESVAAAVRAADPASFVVMAGVASGNYTDFVSASCPASSCVFDRGFVPGVMRRLKTDGRLSNLDYLALHFYSSQGPTFGQYGTDLIGRIKSLNSDIQAAGLASSELKPYVVDEGSYTGMVGASSSSASDPFNVNQRNYVIQVLARAAAMNVAAYFWFWNQDQSTGLGSDNAYGLLDSRGNQKPSFAALAYFNSLIDAPSRFVTSLALPAKLEGYQFTTADGRLVQIVWNQADTSPVSYTPSVAIASATDSVGNAIGITGNTANITADPQFLFFPLPVSGPLAVYRLQKIPNHLFTASPAERDSAVSQYGWTLEGTAFCVPAGQDPSLQRVYRLNKGNEFLYTLSAAERDNAVAIFGYVYQGVAYLASQSPGTGLTPVHRLRNAFEHIYMQDPTEIRSAVGQFGYIDEGVALYAPGCSSSAATQVVRSAR